MKFTPQTHDYLAGKRFSNSLLVKIASPEARIQDRAAVLEALAANKSIVHVGFADHSDLLESKLAAGTWLHSRLCQAASRCVGVDINESAVANAKKRLGLDDLYCHDLTSPQTLDTITSARWDWLFLPEILEHVDNPVDFLLRTREFYGSCFAGAVLTVPNAFALMNFKQLLRHKEYINSDHRYWFTPYTAAKVCERAGWKVDEYFFCQSNMPSHFYETAALKILPTLRQSIVLIIRPQ